MTSRGPVVRALAGLGLVVATVLALASSVVLHGAAVLVVVLAAGGAACVAYMAQNAGRTAAFEWAWQAAAATVAVIVLVTGVVVLAGGSVAALLSGLALATGGAWWLLKTRRPGRAGSTAATGVAPSGNAGNPKPVLAAAGVSPWQPPVSLLGTSDLGSEWLRTTSELASPVASAMRQEIIRRRQETLDELERRDPAGFARWLAAGAATGSDPATFVREDRTSGRDLA